ncbi:MAG: HYR domain-containing protein, partial [Christiangramia sp.]|nr:HYR domain-containing protein [Christiangramia sp.]
MDTDMKGNVYVLSFGKGVDKLDENGDPINLDFISENQLDSPLDMAVDNQGYIYIVDYLASGEFFDNGKVKVFDPEGNFLSSRTILTSFYRPIGVVVDETNVYVAEFNDGNSGPESSRMSRIRIYDKLTGSVVASTSQVDAPYRIGIDSQKNVYVSQAGNNVPKLLIFDSSLQNSTVLDGLTSPGSVVIDSFDFIHVLEYSNRIDFEKFINYENLSSTEALNLYNEIDQGIENNEFEIKIFDSNRNLVKTLTDNDNNDLNIEFPVDLAFNQCNKMYTVNANTVGGNSLDFDLEIYKRTPALDITSPEITCPVDIIADAQPGNNYAIVDYTTATATDACGVTVTRTAGLASGSQFPVGENTVEFTATDSFGNTSTCTFKITVNPAENPDEPPIFANCPSNISVDNEQNKCGAVVNFATPSASDENGNVPVAQTEGSVSGSEFPVGATTVTFSATDDEGNTTECSFTVTVSDTEDPVIACPSNIEETVPVGEDGKMITYSAPTFDDNCPGASVEQTEGLPSGSEFPLGDTVNTFVVTDVAGETSECSFTVTITESEDTEDPVITCPASISRNNDDGLCGAIVNFDDPVASDNSGNVSVERIDSGPESGELFPVGVTTVSFRATDNSGNSAECSFNVTIADNELPQVNCVSNYTITIAQDETRTITAADLDNGSTDNCEITNLSLSKDTFTADDEGVVTVILTATDAANNSSSCEVNVEVNVTQETTLSLNCPGDYEVFANENCQYFVPDFSEIVEVSPPGASIQQSMEPGSTTITN